MAKTKLPADVMVAIESAQRRPGWNNRSPEIKRFDLGGCTLYVVPCRRWAYNRRERLAEAWREQQLQLIGH